MTDTNAGPVLPEPAPITGSEAQELRERVAELEREWVKHPQTIEAKAQWDAVALALGADKDCPDAVRAAASRLRAAEIKLRAENEALRADAEWKLTADALPEDGRLVLFEVDAKAPSRFEYLDGQVFACTYYTANERYGSAFGVPGLTIRASRWRCIQGPPAIEAVRAARETK